MMNSSSSKKEFISGTSEKPCKFIYVYVLPVMQNRLHRGEKWNVNNKYRCNDDIKWYYYFLPSECRGFSAFSPNRSFIYFIFLDKTAVSLDDFYFVISSFVRPRMKALAGACLSMIYEIFAARMSCNAVISL